MMSSSVVPSQHCSAQGFTQLSQLLCVLLWCLTIRISDDIILINVKSAYEPVNITLIKITTKLNVTGFAFIQVFVFC